MGLWSDFYVFIFCLHVICYIWEIAKQIKWKITTRVCNFLFQDSLEIEISHLNWDFQRFPWYFSIGLICTNKVELPIVKHTLTIKYLCMSCSFLGFFKGIFKVMGVPHSGLQYLWEFQRQRRTKKSVKRMICANHKMFEKKALELLL